MRVLHPTLVPGRPHPAAARPALRGTARVRARCRQRAPGARGRGGRCSRHGLRTPHTRRADGPAWRSRGTGRGSADARARPSTALDPALDADPDRVAGAALGSADTGADPALAALAALCCTAPGELEGFVKRRSPWEAAGPRRGPTCGRRGPELAAALQGPLRPSELHALLAGEPPEALALALGLGAPGEPVLRYLSDLQGAGLQITGDDLLSAGVPPLSGDRPGAERDAAAQARR